MQEEVPCIGSKNFRGFFVERVALLRVNNFGTQQRVIRPTADLQPEPGKKDQGHRDFAAFSAIS
jgi:hypothetical protein